MLIRNQRKTLLLNYSNSDIIDTMEIDRGYIVACLNSKGTYTLGKYSQKEKVIKVLDMIQEAYADAELIPMIVPNIGKMFAEAPASKENELLGEAIGKALMNKMVFQMPEDSEVEA